MKISITQALGEVRQLVATVRAGNRRCGDLVNSPIDALCDAVERLAAAVDHQAKGWDRSDTVDVPPSAWVSLSSGPEVQP